MRILQICVLLLGVNLLLPTIAVHFMDVSSDEVVCELMEDFGEEEEEDGETAKDLEDTFFANCIVVESLKYQRNKSLLSPILRTIIICVSFI